MIAGHLQAKKGNWYVVLSLKDENGKRKPKWLPTHLKEVGNKKKAEEMLQDYRRQYTAIETINGNSKGLYFDEFMLMWLKGMKNKVSATTYSGYKQCICNSICPYFKEKRILLNEIKPKHVHDYYNHLLERAVSSNTVIHHHANIHQALQEAYMNDLISYSPTDKIQRPKKVDYLSHPYSPQESNILLEAAKGEKLELVIILSLFYGLRRSEVLGLRWSSIDFDNDTIFINHSITQVGVDGKYSVLSQDKLKNKSSFRTLPLIEIGRAHV